MNIRPDAGHSIVLVVLAGFAVTHVTFGETTLASSPSPSPVDANGNALPETERVIVTGSNIPTAEEVGPNPVDTYSRDDLARLAVRTPTDFVERLPAESGFTSNDNNPITGTGATHISLRGIDPKETLTLQEGRRLATEGHGFPAVDFNVFPIGLIDHIDVLKDGASPVYGTDAVAGVVNVFLIHRFRDVEVYASYGSTNLGFADNMGQLITYLLAGTGDDKTDIVVYAGTFNQDAIYSRDLDFAKDLDARPFGGSDQRSGIFAGRVGNFVYQPSLNGGSQTPTPHAFPNVESDPQYVPRLSLPRELQRFNQADFTVEIAPTDRQYLYGSVVRDLYDKSLSVFGDFKYFHQFTDAVNTPRPFGTDIWTDATHPTGISPNVGSFSVPLQNPFNPFTVADYVSPGGFNPQFPGTRISAAPAGTAFTTGVRYRDLQVPFSAQNTTDNYLFTGGLKGTLGEFATAWDALKTWQWEVAVRYNEDDRIGALVGVTNHIALRAALLDTNPATAFNPFGLSNNSQAVLSRVFITDLDVGSVTLLTEDFKLNGDLVGLPGGPVSFAIGTEHLSNDVTDTPSKLRVSGQVGNASFSPTHGNVDSWSEYWELRIPLTGPTWNFPGAHSLELDYAERYENFSAFGETLRPKFSLRWQPFGGSPVPITLRAAYIEAFHAPSVIDLFGGTSEGIAPIKDPRSPATEPQVDVDFTSNPNLKPEIAYEHTFGGVLTPESWWSALHGLTISVDYGHINLRGFETELDPQFVVDHESEFPGLVQRNPNAGNQIVLIRIPELNLGGFIESYIDYGAVETFETARLGHGDWGTFTATLNGTYLVDVDIQVLPNGKRTTAVGKFGGGFQGPGGGGAYTHNRDYVSLFYDGAPGTCMQGVETGAIVHYIGQYWDNRDFTANGKDRKVREWTTLDLISSYTFNLPAPVAPGGVPGYAKGGDTATAEKGKEKNWLPISTAEYMRDGWRPWLNNTTLTLGVNNVFNLEPPFVAAAPIGNYDQSTANPKGRFWYVAVKKRF